MSTAVQGTQAVTLRLISRKAGATVEQIANANDFVNTKQSRGQIDRLRAKGIKVKNVGPNRFKIATRGRKG
jgi:LysM repeat protein